MAKNGPRAVKRKTDPGTRCPVIREPQPAIGSPLDNSGPSPNNTERRGRKSERGRGRGGRRSREAPGAPRGDEPSSCRLLIQRAMICRNLLPQWRSRRAASRISARLCRAFLCGTRTRGRRSAGWRALRRLPARGHLNLERHAAKAPAHKAPRETPNLSVREAREELADFGETVLCPMPHAPGADPEERLATRPMRAAGVYEPEVLGTANKVRVLNVKKDQSCFPIGLCEIGRRLWLPTLLNLGGVSHWLWA